MVCVLACACPGRRARAPAATGSDGRPASVLARRTDIARATLGYASAFAGQRYLVTVELSARFELIVRDIAGPEKAREVARVALGSPDYDIEDMAVDGQHMRAFVAGRDGRVRGFALPSGDMLVTWHLGSPATTVAVSPDGALVVMGTDDGLLCLRRYRDGALLHCALAHEARISDLAISADGGQLASASFTGEVVRWQLPSLAVVERRTFPGAISALAFAPGDRRLAVAQSSFPPVRSPEVAARERRGAYRASDPGQVISIWQPGEQPAQPMLGHGGPITSLTFTPGGRRLVSGSWDRTLRLWDPRAGRELDRVAGFSGLIRDVAVDGAGRRLAVAAWSDGRAGRSIALVELRP
jgi:hypothetical protein